MKKINVIISFLALTSCIISSILCAGNSISAETNKTVLFVGTIIWFVVTPFWMKRKRSN